MNALTEFVVTLLMATAVFGLVWRRHLGQAEQERLERERTRSIFEAMQEGLVLQDAHGQIVEWNPASERILGLSADRLAGRRADDPTWDAIRADGTPLPPEEHPSVRARTSREPVLDELVGMLQGDGSVTWVVVNAQPMLDEVSGELHGVVVSFVDITARKAAEEARRAAALHDPLTGLPNRAMLLDRLDHALTRAQRRGEQTALLFVDLDRFKSINDTLGHAAGDELLVEVATRLVRTVRADDTVARLGGDEFVVLTEDVGGVDLRKVARRINDVLATPIELTEGPVAISASIGIAYDRDHRPDSLLRDADDALYRAKTRGKNRFEVFDDELRAEALRRVTREQILRRALDTDDGIVVHYQPVIDLTSGVLLGAEALMRIRGPHDRFESNETFVPIAEETGLIVTIGAGIMDDACRQLALWRARYGLDAPQQVAVNVSARQLAAPGLYDTIVRTLDRTGLQPRDLCVELTESTVISADGTTSRTVEQLHELGVSLAIDDFGTGYSSLSYLKRFPVDILKIDRSFVAGLGTDASDTEIVKAVISLGRSLGLTTVAEGIETPEQLAALQELGCDGGQGYLLARPFAGDQMMAAVELARTPGRARA